MAKRIVRTDPAKADVRSIEQPVALQILRTLARYAKNETGNVKLLKGVDPPMLRLRAQGHRVFFRNQGDYIELHRILDRKEAYRQGSPCYWTELRCQVKSCNASLSAEKLYNSLAVQQADRNPAAAQD